MSTIHHNPFKATTVSSEAVAKEFDALWNDIDTTSAELKRQIEKVEFRDASYLQAIDELRRSINALKLAQADIPSKSTMNKALTSTVEAFRTEINTLLSSDEGIHQSMRKVFEWSSDAHANTNFRLVVGNIVWATVYVGTILAWWVTK